MATTRASERRSRSTTVGDAPAPTERATSLAFALRISSDRADRRSAANTSASSFAEEESVASSRAAAFARCPRSGSDVVGMTSG
jgi:hypothetical protein